MINKIVFGISVIGLFINLSVSNSLDFHCFLAGINFGMVIIFAMVILYEK